ncbi:hypothetical protein [Bradyrhizobium forestalis]|uniref:hypothetical protein n=1 Tax=Bradyrhizobium forestalis TaxID=1419263 RepID=UPI001FE0C032|nr:hypothetical protein [Bradyrhizobium forestalis]
MLPRWKRAKPYVYSDVEIDASPTAALALPPGDGLRRRAYIMRQRNVSANTIASYRDTFRLLGVRTGAAAEVPIGFDADLLDHRRVPH